MGQNSNKEEFRMILAEKITEERKKNGWSQEEMADKLGVSRQAVSKWESAQSIPDLQRVIQMAELFGVSTDYLLRDEMSPAPYEGEPMAPSSVRRVSLEEANAFLDMKRRIAPRIADATALCILSPALLILLGGLAEAGIWRLGENLAAGLGLVCLLGMVAAAVYIFITSGLKGSGMEYLEKENFETGYGVTGMAREKQAAFAPTFSRTMAGSVAVCILAVVPLLIGGLMDAPDYICTALTSLMLVLVAGAVDRMIRVGILKNSYDTLLQEGDYTAAEKRARWKLEAFHGAYWCIAVAIFLWWSFRTGDWKSTWIVWPVAGVLFAALNGILRTVLGAGE